LTYKLTDLLVMPCRQWSQDTGSGHTHR